MATSGSFNTTSEDGRYLTFYWERSSYSIENNQTKIYYKVTGAGASGWVTCGNFKLTLDGSTVYSSSTRVNVYAGDVICEGYHTFTHNSVGDKNFSAYLEAGIFYVAVNCSGSGSWALPNIPRASHPSLSKTTFDLGSSVTIYTNAAASSFKHNLYYSWGEQSWFTIATGVAGSYSWTPPLSMAEYIPSKTSGTGQIRCDTYSGSTLLGTKYVNYTATVPASVKPSVSAIVTEPTNHIAKYGAMVSGKSKLRIQSTGEGVYGSTIKSYAVEVDGKTYTGSDVTTDALTSGDIKVTVTDSRGRVSEPWTESFTVLDYAPPAVTKLSVHRCDADGTENEKGEYAVATFSAAITALRNYNAATYKLKYTPLGVTNPTTTTVALTALTGSYEVNEYSTAPFAADGNYSYEVEIVATDDFGSSARVTSVSTAFTLMNWGPSGDCMAIGKVAEMPNTFEVALRAHFHDKVTGAAYGIGLVEEIPGSSNLNNYTSPGVYHVGETATAATMTNIPLAVAGRLCVSYATGYSSAYLEQRFVPFTYGDQESNTQAWLRYSADSGATWSAWITEGLKKFPFGAVYISRSATSPASIFGGVWRQIKDRFILAAGDTYTAGATGGEAAHTLTVSEMPNHGKHLLTSNSSILSTGNATGAYLATMSSYGSTGRGWDRPSGGEHYPAGQYVGGGQAHNNMPPYLVLYVWERIRETTA